MSIAAKEFVLTTTWMLAVVLIITAIIHGCQMTSRSLAVTGETLKGVGQEFTEVAAVYKQGCDITKAIAPEQCKKFRAFGLEFQRSYPVAVQLWEVAREANDTEAQSNLRLLITKLAGDLSAFAVSVIQAHHGGK
jgi:hypothetical protein